MSQHINFTSHNNELTSVLMGWDKPLQGFFMVIDKPDLGLDEPFWSNLNDHNPNYPKTLYSFLKILFKLKITVPKQMIDEILADGEQNMGNKEVFHSFYDGIYTRSEHRFN